MKLSHVMLAAACIAMLSVTGHAQEKAYSANQMMKGCRAFIATTTSDAFLSGICVGIVATLAILEEAATGVCKPEEVTGDRQVRVVAAYIDARPNRLHEDFRVLALEALQDAWPCKR